MRIASTGRTPLAHSGDSSATSLCHHHGPKDTQAMSVDVSLATAGDMMCVSGASRVRSRRPSCCRGTGPPGAGIMPHRQIMSRANCAQAGPRDPRDAAQGTEFSGGGRTNTDQEVPPRPGETAQSYPSGSLRESVRSARAGRLTGRGAGVRIPELQPWPPRRGPQWAVVSWLANRSNAIPCLLQLNSSCSIDGAT